MEGDVGCRARESHSFEGGFLSVLLVLHIGLFRAGLLITAVKQNVVLPTVRATAVTVALLMEHLLGDSYAPFAIGKLSDALHNLQLALLILLPPLLVLAAVFAALGLRYEEADGRAMESQWAVGATQIP